MIHQKFHYHLFNAKSKELDQKHQNNNKEMNMNIKKRREEKRREDNYFSGGGRRKIKGFIEKIRKFW